MIEAGKWARGPFAGTLEDELAIQVRLKRAREPAKSSITPAYVLRCLSHTEPPQCAAADSPRWCVPGWPQDETGATLRCYPLQQPTSLWGGFHTCLYSGYHASEVAIFARPL